MIISIVSLTWILAYPESAPGVKETLRYMLSEKSQAKSDALGYVLSQKIFDKGTLLPWKVLTKLVFVTTKDPLPGVLFYYIICKDLLLEVTWL